MIITLSEERNEKLILEWSGEITDKHAQDFCDVCNAVFNDHFDLDYMRRKYDENIYGRSFIVLIYKDGIPVAAEGAWRNDTEGRPSFQICDTATLPSMRKRGYNTKLSETIISCAKSESPDALVYRFPGPMSFRMSGHLGFARSTRYARVYCGETSDFLASIPQIDDEYVEHFFMKKHGMFIKYNYVKGGGAHLYLLSAKKIKGIVPAGIFLGRINSKYREKFTAHSGLRVLLYYSMKRGILGANGAQNVAKYDPSSQIQVMDFIPPLYKADTLSLDFNGVNR